jgi:DNA invertase Pin-like site-specific DNA recombinase
MEKITKEHLTRRAYVYIRQSTLGQVQHNTESRRVQERLIERAQALGWAEARVIDDDLGCSASGVARRAGFERLLAEVCAGNVGAVFAFEASRLARNGREWHTLLEMCVVVDTLLIDTEAVYDPKLSNDRLLLGFKGTLSELELGLFRARSHAAMREKAKRGQFYGMIAVGYRKTRDGHLEKEPDLRVQHAIEFVFEKFVEFGSARQLVLWMREEGVKIPCRDGNTDDSPICWRSPTQSVVTRVLKNPIYAGVYVYGRSKSRTVLEDGRKRVIIRKCWDPKEWEVVIQDHHPGYINWEQYERNIQMLRQNVNLKGHMAPGGVRGGASVFAGILRCGECGRKVLVHYSGAHAKSISYSCYTNTRNDDGKRCLQFSAGALEKALVQQLLEAVSPLGVGAALKAAELLADEGRALRQQKELELTQARYECELARRQYDSVDPHNRLVAGELERRWNVALERAAQLEEELEGDAPAAEVAAEEYEALMTLGQDLEAAWEDSEAAPELKKRIARAVVKEVVLFAEEETIRAVLHWQGGEHTEVKVRRLRLSDNGSATNAEALELIRVLARQMHDRFIAQVLNRLKRSTARGLSWNEARVRAIRCGHDIAVYENGERERRGELNMLEAAQELGVDRSTVGKLIATGCLPAAQVCKCAPWIIRREDLRRAEVQAALRRGKFQAPCGANRKQLSFEIQ